MSGGRSALCWCFGIAVTLGPLAASAADTAALKPGDVLLKPGAVLTVGPDGKTAVGSITFENTTKDPIAVTIAFGDFANSLNGLTAASSLTPRVDGADLRTPVAIPAGSRTMELQLASTAWQPGENVATLTGNGLALGQVAVRNLNPSLSKIAVATAEYWVTPGEPNLLSIRNTDDRFAFPLLWRLVIDGVPSGYRRVDIRPGETARTCPELPGGQQTADCRQTFVESWQDGWLKEKKAEGRVEFLVAGANTNSTPLRSLPVKVVVVRSWQRKITGDIAIFLLLLAGAAGFYLVKVALPNLLQLAAMRSRVSELRRRTTAISDRIDCRLRVLIQVETDRLAEASRHAGRVFNPSFADSQAAYNAAIDALSARLDHVEILDGLRADFYALSPDEYPPRAIFEMDVKLQSAADLLRQLRPSAGDIENARTILNDARVQMKSFGEGSDVGVELAAEAKRLRDAFARLDSEVIDPLLDQFPSFANVPGSGAPGPRKGAAAVA